MYSFVIQLCGTYAWICKSIPQRSSCRLEIASKKTTAAWAIAILIPKSRWRCRLGTMKRLDCLGCREGDVVEFHDHTGQTEKQRAGSLWKPRWHWRYTYRCFMGMQRIRSGSQVVKMELFEVFSMTCRVGCLVCAQPHLRLRWAATI